MYNPALLFTNLTNSNMRLEPTFYGMMMPNIAKNNVSYDYFNIKLCLSYAVSMDFKKFETQFINTQI
jgi:hypothetical protein